MIFKEGHDSPFLSTKAMLDLVPGPFHKFITLAIATLTLYFLRFIYSRSKKKIKSLNMSENKINFQLYSNIIIYSINFTNN